MSGDERPDGEAVLNIATAAAAGGGPAAEALEERAAVGGDDVPALDVDPGDAGPVQEDDDLPPADEHQGENDDDE